MCKIGVVIRIRVGPDAHLPLQGRPQATSSIPSRWAAPGWHDIAVSRELACITAARRVAGRAWLAGPSPGVESGAQRCRRLVDLQGRCCCACDASFGMAGPADTMELACQTSAAILQGCAGCNDIWGCFSYFYFTFMCFPHIYIK